MTVNLGKALAFAFWRLREFFLIHVELPHPRVLITVLSFLIVVVNLRFFGYGKHLAWLHYKKEFEGYSPRARLVGSFLTFAVVLSLVALMMVTGYAVSQIPH